MLVWMLSVSMQVYRYIEPLYSDFRKLRKLNADGGYSLAHVDEIAQDMIFMDFLFDIALPRIPKRIDLEVPP
jgi:pre-mRNA-splicing factor 38A